MLVVYTISIPKKNTKLMFDYSFIIKYMYMVWFNVYYIY